MFALLSPVLWRAVAAAAILASLIGIYAWWTGHQRDIGRDEVRAEWAIDRASIAEQSRLAMASRDRDTMRLQAQADKRRGADYAEKHALNLRLAESLSRLRERPERPDASTGGVPEVAGAGTTGLGNAGCTGAGLYRDDSAALIRLGAAGDQLRIALKSCRAARQADIETVNKP